MSAKYKQKTIPDNVITDGARMMGIVSHLGIKDLKAMKSKTKRAKLESAYKENRLRIIEAYILKKLGKEWTPQEKKKNQNRRKA